MGHSKLGGALVSVGPTQPHTWAGHWGLREVAPPSTSLCSAAVWGLAGLPAPGALVAVTSSYNIGNMM